MEVRTGLRDIGDRIHGAYPVFVFFISSFFLIYFLFGLHFTITVPPMAAFFSAGRNGKSTRFPLLVFHEMLLLVLATAGSANIWIATILNVIVPFILVFTQSSQFNPRGYYTYMLMFVYLSFVPPADIREFSGMLLSLWILTAYMGVFLWLINHTHRSENNVRRSLREFLGRLSGLTALLAEPEKLDECRRMFVDLMHDISYGRQSFSALSTGDVQIRNMMSTLLQRFSYMLSDHDWRSELDTAHVLELRRLSSYLSDAAGSIGTPWQGEQTAVAETLLNTMKIPEGHIRIFIRSVLHMMDFMLHALEEDPYESRRRRVDWKNIRHELAIRLNLESFEMRFALRLAIVMAVSDIVNHMIPMTHSYWVPLNAFLLLQPDTEDSNYYMKTNPLGTFIGCLVEYIIYPFLPGLWAQIVFALLMISLMYCSVPGTWYHPAFHTCYTLTIAMITLGETSAISLRLLYLAAALIIVFIVNRFFFPIRQSSQFRYSIKALFRLHNKYWNIIREGLVSKTDLSVSTDILTDFHLYYESSVSYMERHPEMEGGKELHSALMILWDMFSQLEQIHYLVRIKSVQEEETEQMFHLITAIQKDLYPIIRYEDFPSLHEEIRLQRRDIAYVIDSYLRNAEKLLIYKNHIPF